MTMTNTTSATTSIPDDHLAHDLGISLREVHRIAKLHGEELGRYGAFKAIRERLPGTQEWRTRFTFNPVQAELVSMLADCEGAEVLREEMLMERARAGFLTYGPALPSE